MSVIMSKVLLVYPNGEAYPFIPLAFSILSSILKAGGHEVDLFDVTFSLGRTHLDHQVREAIGIVEKTNITEYWGGEKRDVDNDLINKIVAFSPDLIGISIVESNYRCAKHLIDVIKANCNVPIIVGGTFPTVDPQRFLADPNVDMVCIGEGERVMLEVTDNLDNKTTKPIRSQTFTPSEFYDWEPYIPQDWSVFDERHLMKPFMGKVYRTGCFELSRGCIYRCSYCINALFQQRFQHLGRYRREKKISYALREISYLKDEYSLELIWFHDENFGLMDDARLEDFCKHYEEEIGLPFFMQSSADTLIKEWRVKRLKDAGCVTVSIGVETGNEEIRRTKLNKNIKNETLIRAFDNCRKYKVRTTANVMIGLPGETEEEILETAKFCRRCNPNSVGVSIFCPYHGIPLRDECIKMGLMEDQDYNGCAFKSKSVLKMPQISEGRLSELFHDFNSIAVGPNG